jgi:hypothetical protein
MRKKHSNVFLKQFFIITFVTAVFNVFYFVSSTSFAQNAETVESGCVKREVKCKALKSGKGQILKAKTSDSITLDETVSMSNGKKRLIMYPDKFSKDPKKDPDPNDVYLTQSKSFENKESEQLECCQDDKCVTIDKSVGKVTEFAKVPIDFVPGSKGQKCGAEEKPKPINDAKASKEKEEELLRDKENKILADKLNGLCQKNAACKKRQEAMESKGNSSSPLTVPELTPERRQKVCDSFINSPKKDVQNALPSFCAGS